MVAGMYDSCLDILHLMSSDYRLMYCRPIYLYTLRLDTSYNFKEENKGPKLGKEES